MNKNKIKLANCKPGGGVYFIHKLPILGQSGGAKSL